MICPIYMIGHTDLAVLVSRISRHDRNTYRACLAVLRCRAARGVGDYMTARMELALARELLSDAYISNECAPC
jgi:hypothetical protein